jgi:hypothetical protein
MEEAWEKRESPGPGSWGLCSSCQYVQPVPNDRGRVFVLCQASGLNPRLPKYPHLPVYACPAYKLREV